MCKESIEETQAIVKDLYAYVKGRGNENWPPESKAVSELLQRMIHANHKALKRLVDVCESLEQHQRKN